MKKWTIWMVVTVSAIIIYHVCYSLTKKSPRNNFLLFFADLQICFQWSWRDSNPRPNILPIRFLHAYSGIVCRERAGAGRTNFFLSCILLICSHSLLQKQPVFF